jgi:hypothetical protein
MEVNKMNKNLILDDRKANDIYQQALYLAHKYCDTWVSDPKSKAEQKPSEDQGLVILKLFAFLTEYLLGQLNQIPHKDCLVFFDFIGMTPLPAKSAAVPLTFQLAEDVTTSVVVSAGTLVGSTESAEFETKQSLLVINTGLDTAKLINPKTDQYIDYSSILTNEVSEIPNFQPLDHILYLVDHVLFDIKRNPQKFQIIITGNNLEEKYFENWFNNNNLLKTQVVSDNGNYMTITFQGLLTRNESSTETSSLNEPSTEDEESSTDNVPSGYWIGVRTELSSNTSLPSIFSITANLTIKNIIPDSALFNDTPLELKKGVFPFGKTPVAMDTLYIGSTEAFSKPNSSITIAFDVNSIDFANVGASEIKLNWEFWDGNNWKIIGTTGIESPPIEPDNSDDNEVAADNDISASDPIPFTENIHYDFTDTTEAFTKPGDVTFTCPPIEKSPVNEIENWWIRVIIISDGYGTVGDYIETISAEDLLGTEKRTNEVYDALIKSDELKAILEKIQEAVNNTCDALENHCETSIEEACTDCQMTSQTLDNILENYKETLSQLELTESQINDLITQLNSVMATEFECLETQLEDCSSTITSICSTLCSSFRDMMTEIIQNILGQSQSYMTGEIIPEVPGKGDMIKKIIQEILGKGDTTEETIPKIVEILLKGCIASVLDEVADELSNEGYDFGFKYTPPAYFPPYINSMLVKFEYLERPISEATTYNNFNYEVITNEDEAFFPYSRAEETSQTLYLGFNGEIKDTLITLFLRFMEESLGYDYTQSNEPVPSNWFYKTGSWKSLGIEKSDDINNMHIPADISKELFLNQKRYWLKLENNSLWERLNGIFPNTVIAVNSTITQNEILGSGNGTADLKLLFTKTPVLTGEIVEILEPFRPIESKNFNKQNITIIQNESGEEEIWVQWQAIDDFALASPLDTVYVLDRQTGEITFGNGQQGMIPPKGRNNIIAREYSSGGGKPMDLNIGAIQDLKTAIAGIDNVTNPVPPVGGMDKEKQEKTVKQAPYRMKSRDRAVAAEDYIVLVQEASQDVAKSSCLYNEDKIKVIIVPKSTSRMPQPDTGLTDEIQQYIQKRTLITLSDRIQVLGPDYEYIDVDVTIQLGDEPSFEVKNAIETSLTEYLMPLTGQKDKQGWDFGAVISTAEIAGIIGNTQGVEYIICIEILSKNAENGRTIQRAAGFTAFLQVREYALPTPGQINITFSTQE